MSLVTVSGRQGKRPWGLLGGDAAQCVSHEVLVLTTLRRLGSGLSGRLPTLSSSPSGGMRPACEAAAQGPWRLGRPSVEMPCHPYRRSDGCGCACFPETPLVMTSEGSEVSCWTLSHESLQHSGLLLPSVKSKLLLVKS